MSRVKIDLVTDSMIIDIVNEIVKLVDDMSKGLFPSRRRGNDPS